MKIRNRIALGAGLVVALIVTIGILRNWPGSGEGEKVMAAVAVTTPAGVQDIQPAPPAVINSPPPAPISPASTSLAGVRDPEGLLQMLKGRPPGATDRVMPTALILIARSSDPFAAARYISSMPEDAARTAYILRLAPVLGAGPKRDPAATLDWLDKVAHGDTYRAAVASTMTALAASNPKAAADVIDKISDPGARLAAISTVAGAWAKSDPQFALAWASALPTTDATAQTSAMNAIVTSWSRKDPVAVAAFVQKAPDPSLFLPADPVIAQALAATNPQAALAFSQSLPPGDAKYQSLTNVIVTIAKTDFATAWNNAASLPSADNPIGIMASLVGVQAKKDPAQAAALIPQVPGAAGQAAATTALAAIWVAQDPQAFTVWLDGLPPGDIRDAAIVQLVSSSQSTKNPDGVRAWVNTVSDPQTKSELVRKLTPAGK